MSIKPLQTRLVIAIQRPHLWLLTGILLVCIVVAGFWLSFEYGRNVAGYHSAETDSYIQQLKEQLEESQAKIVESKRRATMIERNSRIDVDASAQLKESLSQAQSEVLKLKKELSFYKSIVAPEQGSRSLAIQTIQLKKNDAGGFSYKIMVTQRGRNDQFARGTVDVTIEGTDKGNTVTYKLSEISKDTKQPMKFGFKYFQNFEGVMNLPDGFQPDAIRIKVNPKTGKIKAVDEQFAWSDLTAGGA